MSLYDETVPQFTNMLSNIDAWLDLAVEHGKKKGFDPAVLLTSRLAPDQFHLVRQVQAACDQAKAAAARLTGQEPPKHPDTETTIDELKARTAKVRDYLVTFTPKHFEGAEERLVPLAFMQGKGMRGVDYARQFVLPNFYFHATLVYEILRHNGVDLGKRHFVTNVTLRDL
jgi:hypothetical protein